jgi:hypothetical protein
MYYRDKKVSLFANNIVEQASRYINMDGSLKGI